MKSFRAVGRAAGAVIDKEDRELLGRLVVIGVGAALGIVSAAAVAGLAIRVFEAVSNW